MIIIRLFRANVHESNIMDNDIPAWDLQSIWMSLSRYDELIYIYII
jgi:hypothetical protein